MSFGAWIRDSNATVDSFHDLCNKMEARHFWQHSNFEQKQTTEEKKLNENLAFCGKLLFLQQMKH